MNKIIEIYSASHEETLELGRSISLVCSSGEIITLSGELGAGKTVIAKGIASGLGITEEITSPTYTLLEIYDAPIPLYHFDLYRISDTAEFCNLAFDEYWYGSGISLIEWPERAGGLLPEPSIKINICYESEKIRRILIEYTGDRRFD